MSRLNLDRQLVGRDEGRAERAPESGRWDLVKDIEYPSSISYASGSLMHLNVPIRRLASSYRSRCRARPGPIRARTAGGRDPQSGVTRRYARISGTPTSGREDRWVDHVTLGRTHRLHPSLLGGYAVSEAASGTHRPGIPNRSPRDRPAAWSRCSWPPPVTRTMARVLMPSTRHERLRIRRSPPKTEP
jgi:hypothetical protein